MIINRILHLVKEMKVEPSSILALTFSNKAAREMKVRLKATNAFDQASPWIGTFHSFCMFMLKKKGSCVGLSPSFTIIDKEGQTQLAKTIIKRSSSEISDPDRALHLVAKSKSGEVKIETIVNGGWGLGFVALARCAELCQQMSRKPKSTLSSVNCM